MLSALLNLITLHVLIPTTNPPCVTYLQGALLAEFGGFSIVGTGSGHWLDSESRDCAEDHIVVEIAVNPATVDDSIDKIALAFASAGEEAVYIRTGDGRHAGIIDTGYRNGYRNAR